MIIADCLRAANNTLLVLSDSLPKGTWRTIVINGQQFEPLPIMYAGDVSKIEDNAIGIRREHDFTGKEISFF